MKHSIVFLEDFATFKKGDDTDVLSGDIVSSLKRRGIAKDYVKKAKPIKKAVAKKVKSK